jgi:hypothetical protein
MSAITRLLAVAMAAIALPTMAAPTVFTSSASFQARIAPGAYTENFDALGALPSGPVAFSGGAFTYSVSALGDLFATAGALSTNEADDAITIDIGGGGAHAIGGNFFASDFDGSFFPTSISLILSDGSVETFSPTSLADSFRGFVFDNQLITSLVISGPGAGLYATLDDLTVGTIPEPTSIALVAVAAFGLLATRRRPA